MLALSRVFFAASALVVLAAPLSARAQATTSSRAGGTSEDVPATPAPPPPIDEARPSRPRDHVEFTMGFLGGQRAYDGLSFGLDTGSPAAQIPGAAKLTRPFTQAPYSRVNMVGLRYEARVHI